MSSGRVTPVTDPINVHEIMRELRARIQNREAHQKSSFGFLPPKEPIDWLQLEEAIRALESASSQIGEQPPEPPTFRGRIGSFIVKLVRRALFWYTPQILQFQVASARVIYGLVEGLKANVELGQRRWRAAEALSQELIGLRAETEHLRDELGFQTAARNEAESRFTEAFKLLEALRERVDLEIIASTAALNSLGERMDSEIAARETLGRDVSATKDRSEKTDLRLLQLRAEVIDQSRRISILLEESRKRLPEPFNEEQLTNIAGEAKHVLDAMYVSFEDRFRGTRTEIKERLKIYLPYLQQRMIGTKEMPIIDIGCGRGEWLELLRENQLTARGVDLNRLLLAQCQERGLDVTEDDALRHLRNLAPSSVGVVTGFHIVEHISIDTLVKVLDETIRVLKPGGIALFETPNAGNVLVGSHNFYLDFTHRNPLPSETMQFLLEARGFCDVQVLNLHPYPESLHLKDDGTEVTKRFNEYFYGPQDYAVIGRRV